MSYMFSKHVYELLITRNEGSRNQLLSDNITNKIAVHLYMFGPLVEDMIASYINNRLVITIYRHWTILNKSKFPQQSLQSYHLTDCMSYCSILSFGARARHNALRFTLPSNQIASNISAIVIGRFFLFYLPHNYNLKRLQSADVYASYITSLFQEILLCMLVSSRLSSNEPLQGCA